MANATIDNLQIKITATATDAASALQKLADSLKGVREALGKTGKDGQTYGAKINRNLTDLQNAITKLNPDKFKKLAELSDSVAISIGAVNTSLEGIKTDGIRKLSLLTLQLKEYAAALREVKDAGKGIVFAKIPKMPATDTTDTPASDTALDDTAESSGETARTRMSLGDWYSKISQKVAPAFEKIRAVSAKVRGSIAGVAERFKELGKNVSFSSGVLGKFFKSIGRIAFYRAIRSAIKAVGQAFEEGLKNAYLYSQQTEGFERLANALDRLKSVTSQMVNQLGAFWGEFRQFIQPAVTWLIEKVRQLAQFLTELFAALNGDTQYQYALLEDLKWQEATEDLKKYKQQLLGLDEINNLTTKQESGKKEEDVTTKYELRPIRESLRAVGQGWQSIKQTISDAYDEIGGLAYLPAGMLALGSILLFTGHPLLGIALVMKGAQWSIQEYEYNNEENKRKIDGFFAEYQDLFDIGSAAAIAIGTMLLFIPGHRALGLGLILGGKMLENLVHDKVKFSWGGLLETISKKFAGYESFIKGTKTALTALGTILLFVPGFRGLGLGLIMAGITLDSLADTIPDFSWGGLLKTIKQKFDDYKAMFVKKSPAAVAIGALLLFVPGMSGIGLALIKGGAAGLFIGALDHDWNGLLKNLKGAWSAIKSWFEGTVKYELNDIHNKIEEALHWDLNDDGKIGKLATKAPKVVEIGGTDTLQYGRLPNEPTLQTPTAKRIAIQNLEKALYDSMGSGNDEFYISIQNQLGDELGDKVVDKVLGGHSVWDMLWENIKFNIGSFLPTTFKAGGGIADRGTLFYAGEAGPEWVGTMGGNSAVANTGQMTDAIYKAAYMGVSRALQENGGGMNGYEPASMDDLFIAIRKKSSAFTKRTGQPAY